MKKKFITKESKNKIVYSGGAKRNNATGKGRFDLISPIMERRLAELLERGQKIYGDWNWAKGVKLSRWIDSLKRHTNQYVWCILTNNEEDLEDHAAAILFNGMGLMHTKEMIEQGILPKDLDDLPRFVKKNNKKLKNKKNAKKRSQKEKR